MAANSAVENPQKTQIRVLDDAKHSVVLNQAAHRIISLAPHITELVFAAGAGQRLVGVSEYSDFPPEAKKIASVGNVFALDLERILALKPDLIIIWGTGNAKTLVKTLRDNQLTVYESEPHDFEEIASSIERIAILSGTEIEGKKAAQAFRQRLQNLKGRVSDQEKQKPITVFHEMIKSPLMTINQHHFISKMISLCGGRNVFAELKDLSATITSEAVLIANPEFIFASGTDTQALAKEWSRFPSLTAVKKNNFYTVNGDWLHRAGPRVLDATATLCTQIKTARQKSN